MSAPVWLPQFESLAQALADEALAANRAVSRDGYTAWPDVVALEALANGLPPLPETLRLRRPDGRSVFILTDPRATEPRPFATVAEIDEHLSRHAQGCAAAGSTQRVCPCGRTIVLICVSCDDLLFRFTNPTADPCRHAAELGASS